MKINKTTTILGLLLVAAATGVQAQNGVWTNDASGNWSDTTQWAGGIVADGSGNAADFSTINIAADRTVTLDAAHTLTTLKFGDTIPDHNWFLSGPNTLTLAGTTPTIKVVNQTTATISSIIDGTAGMTKSGLGTLDLNGSAVNTFTGTLAVKAGTLTEDFSNLATPVNLINSGAILNMGGGTLNINGAASGDTSQTFASTTYGAGSGSVINLANNGNSVSLVLGAITYGSDCPVQYSPVGTITTTTAGGGPLGLMWVNYSTYGLSDWATTDTTGGTVGTSPYTIIGLDSVAGGYQTTYGNNFDMQTSLTVGGNWATTTIRFNTPTANNVNVNGKWFCPNAILVTPNMGAVNASITLGNWFPNYSTAAGTEWLVQNNTLGYFSNTGGLINNRGSGTVTYVQSGSGTVVMPGTSTVGGGKTVNANSYTGQSYLLGGATVVAVDADLGAPATGAQLNLNGGTVVGNATFTMDNAGANKRNFLLGNNGGGLAAAAGTMMTIDGIISSATAGVGALTIGILASSANGSVQGLLPGSGSIASGQSADTANLTPVFATGTVALSGANTYSGGTILQNAVLNFTSAALGTGGILINGGTLQWNANNSDISSQTVSLLPGGATLDVNGNNVTLAGGIGNGGSGALTVTNSLPGGGLMLQGANTFIGGTTVASGATLGGTGSLLGNVTWNDGAFANLTPAMPLTVAGTVAFNGSGSGNPVTINASGLTTGVYTLLTAGSVTGAVNPVPAGAGAIAPGYVGTVAISNGNSVTLTVVASGIVSTWTDGNASQNWSDAGNWNAGVPHLAGDSAVFGSGGVGLPVTLDASETLGGILFNNASSYTVSGANTLTLDNSANGVTVNVNAGAANAINTAVALNDNVTVSAASGTGLSLGGTIANGSGSKTLDFTGTGTVALSQANSYGPSAGTVGTTVNGITLQLGNSSALGAGDVSVTDNSTLQAGAAGLNVGNNITVAATKTATVDNHGNSLTLSGVISGNGAVTKVGGGLLTLSSGNTYAGGTLINSGVLAVTVGGVSPGDPASVGAVPLVVTPNNIILNGGDLLGGTTVTLNANRGIGIGPTTGSASTNALIDTASGQTFTINGIIASAGNLGANGLVVNSGAGNNGTLMLGGANVFKGDTVISNGVLQLVNPLALQNSTLNYSSGQLAFDGTITTATLGGLSGTNDLGLTNVASAALTLTLGNDNANSVYTGNLSDIGSLTKTGSGTTTIGSGATGGATYTGTTLVDNGVLTLGGVTSMTTANNFLLSGSLGLSYLNLADTAAVTTSGGVYVASEPTAGSDGGNGYPNTCALTVANNASLSAASLRFGGLAGGTRVSSSSVTVTNNGMLTVSGTVDLDNVAGSTAQTTTFNLNGGTATVGNFISTSGGGAHLSQIHFNGGILKASTDDPSGIFLPFLTGLTADVDAGGAKIDTTGYGLTVGANLLHGTGTPDGGLTKLGLGTLTLGGVNTYTGNTVISNGVLALSGSGSIAASSNIVVNAGATFDISATGSYTLATGQTLSNLTATAVLNGNLSTASGIVSVNYASGTPSFMVTNGTFTLDAGTTFTVNNTGTALGAGSYQLVSLDTGATGIVAGNAPATVTVTGNGLAGGGAASLSISNNELYLVVVQSVNTNPATANFSGKLVSGSLQFTWAPDHQGWQIYTNSVGLNSPANWFPIAGSASGTNETVIINPATSKVFFQLRYP